MKNPIKMFHDHGILINAGMIFGFDNDDETVFERTVDFLHRSRVGLVLFSILRHFRHWFYKRLESEGRIIDKDWSHYDGRHVVFQTKSFSRGIAGRLPLGISQILFNTVYTSPHTSNKKNRIARLYFNWAYRRMVIRVPKGGISPLSPILNSLHVKLPAIETKNLIPNRFHRLKKRLERYQAR